MSSKSSYPRRGVPSKPGAVKPKSTTAPPAAMTRALDAPVRLPSRDDHADEAVFDSPARLAVQSAQEGSADEVFDAGAKKPAEGES